MYYVSSYFIVSLQTFSHMQTTHLMRAKSKENVQRFPHTTLKRFLFFFFVVVVVFFMSMSYAVSILISQPIPSVHAKVDWDSVRHLFVKKDP